ncbi:hypothetical protein ACQ4LE_005191 [Meloidogyne hapla]|uniref:Uncharacterized protein n=1 Tax=Meloidogyne hapla TaxID=6305 RepID=A0A1I8B5L7_MELHA
MLNLLLKLTIILINFPSSIKTLELELLPQEFYLPFINVLKIKNGHFLPIIKFQLKNQEEEYSNWLYNQIERETKADNNFENFEEFLKIANKYLELKNNFLENEGFNLSCEATKKLIENRKGFSIACLDENNIPKIITSNPCKENKDECEIETRSRFELKRGRFYCPSEITCITELLLDQIPFIDKMPNIEFQLIINIILFCLIVFVTKEMSII